MSSAEGTARWRLILGDGTGQDAPSPADGPLNMALDQALLGSVAGGGPPVLRLYSWLPPTLSFGRNQPARGLYDEGRAGERGVAFVRRPTGGQAVLHHQELTYAIAAPVALLGKPRTAYRRINEALVEALRHVGVEAAVVDAGAERSPGDLPRPVPRAVGSGPSWTDACFRTPEAGEVVVAGRKLVGSAQRTQSRTILQHGSILLGGTQTPAEELLRARAGDVDPAAPVVAADAGGGSGEAAAGGPGWTTVEAELGHRPEMEALVSGLVTGFEGVLGISLARTTLTFEESIATRGLRLRFASPEWTWRR